MTTATIPDIARSERRTQKARREATRGALLAAAVDLVSRHGANALRLHDVADRAGVTKGALQYHFALRADLAAAVTDHGWQVLTAGLGAVDVSGSLQHRVDAAVDELWAAYSHPAAMAAFLISSADIRGEKPDPRQLEVTLAARELMDQQWAALFDDAPVSPARGAAARRLLRAELVGLVSYPQAGHDSAKPTAELELLKEALVHILSRATAED